MVKNKNEDVLFTGSNGYIIRKHVVGNAVGIEIFDSCDTNLLDEWDHLDALDLEVLKEYLQHQEDERLGRVRLPGWEDYVIYPQGLNTVIVEESTGARAEYDAENARGSEDWEIELLVDPGNQSCLGAWLNWVRETRKAEKEAAVRPWHKASAGELWVLEWNGYSKQPALVANNGKFYLRDCNDSRNRNGVDPHDERIKGARRVYSHKGDDDE